MPVPLRRWTRKPRPSSTPNSQLSIAASRSQKSRSDSIDCCMNLWTVLVLSTFPGWTPAVCSTLRDDVRRRHVLERRAAAVAVQAVRLVVGAEGEQRRRRRELDLGGDDLALEDGLAGGGLDRAEPDLDRVADLVGGRAGFLALRVGDLDRRDVGQAGEVAHLDALDLVELEAGPADGHARRRLVVRRGHQSSLGRLSGLPRRRCSGLSMPLASAMRRQRFGSP